MTPNSIERTVSLAGALGVGADRIRATLNVENYPIARLIEATRIGPNIIEKFQRGGDVSAEQLDMIAGFIKGEYGRHSRSGDWIRAGHAKPEVKPLPMACPELPVGAHNGHPLGTNAPEPTEVNNAPTLNAVPNDSMPTLVDAKPVSVFGTRGKKS